MIAAFVKTKYKVELREVPVSEPKKSQVVVRVNACGVCGSDFIEAGYWAKKWKQFGHEVVGTIHATGEGVTDLLAGDRVVLALSAPCGKCEACLKKMPRYCSQLIIAKQGGFAEYLLVEDTRLLSRISSSLPNHIACMAEPLSVILEAFRLANLCKDDVLFIAGGGFLGALGAMTAHLLGIPVTGILCRRLDDNLRSVQKKTDFKYINWPKFIGKAAKFTPTLRNALDRHVGRTVVLHTAPAQGIPYYLDSLPYAAIVVNIGLSGEAKKNRLHLDAAQNVFRRTQLLSAFPVPCLYLDDAISLIEHHPDEFSKFKSLIVSLEELPQIIIDSPRTTKTIVSMEDETSKRNHQYS